MGRASFGEVLTRIVGSTLICFMNSLIAGHDSPRALAHKQATLTLLPTGQS